MGGGWYQIDKYVACICVGARGLRRDWSRFRDFKRLVGFIPMFALLLAWASIGMMTVPANDARVKNAATKMPRDWTDASGSKHVRAVLLRKDGDKLWFRRSDGKLSFATLSQLSLADRQYVATNPIADGVQLRPES